MKISNLKIGTRLGTGFALVLLLMLAIAAVSIVSLTSIGRISDRIINEDWVKVEAANTINATMRANARRNMEIFFVHGDARTALIERIAANKKTIDEAVALLDELVQTPEGKEILAQFKKERQVYVNSFAEIADLTSSNRAVQARQVLNDVMLPSLDKLQVTVRALVDRQTELTEASGAQMATDIENARLAVGGLTIIALLLGGLLAYLITRSITRPLHKAVAVARTVAGGDLTSQVQVDTKDETGQLLEALQSMNASLVDIVGKVRSGTDSIAGASAQIAAGNEDLSSRTEEQASSLTETAASMEEITSTVKHNADNAQQAHTLAVTASKAASDGGQVVSQAVDTMQAIHESSRKIVDIISVIDGIAFQTNILALNAAVEAARAGEQGRGFAVVASEVRTLAQRSAAAAKEIKQLIENSVERIDQGSTQVSAAGDAMSNIVGSIKRVADIMSEITNASHEQTRGIEQVNVAISQMDEVTQQNSALVEEAAAASQSLQEQAAELARVVSVFRLSGSESAMARHEKDITPPKAARSHQVEHSKPRLPSATETRKPQPEKRELRPTDTAPRKPEPRRTEAEDDWETF